MKLDKQDVFLLNVVPIKVFHSMVNRPGRNTYKISKEVGHTVAHVHKAMVVLKEHGFINYEKNWRENKIVITEEGKAFHLQLIKLLEMLRN